MRQSTPLNPAIPSDYPGFKRSNPRKKWCLIGVPVALVALILIIVVSVVATRKDGNDDKIPVGSQAIKTVCTETRYPNTCTSTLQQYPNPDGANPRDLAVYVLKVLEQSLNESLNSINTTIPTELNPNATKALEDCYELLSDSYEQVEQAIQKLDYLSDPNTVKQQLVDVKTWLSAAATFHDTCLEELVEANNPDYPYNPEIIVEPTYQVTTQGEHISELFSIALYFAKYLTQYSSQLPDLPTLPRFGRKLLRAEDDIEDAWVDRKAHLRRLLQIISTQVPDATVGKDGSGATYTTVQDALDAYETPSNGGLYIIKILPGIYDDGQVKIGSKQTNVVLLGSGMDNTTLTGHESVNGTGTTTFRSATLAVGGSGFLAIDLTVENTAGAINHQAVAIRSSADHAAFFRVRARGFQDTLYTHSFTQYYRNCEISGTVDFVFGNGAAFLQDCALLARPGLLGQQNTYTAQGRTDPEQNTGLVFQNCNFGPSQELLDVTGGPSLYKTYLGRPWKNFSRTILLENNLDAIVQPAGWLNWIGNLYLDTLFYAEYNSRGTGGSIAQRVKWPGVHQYSKASDVQNFLLDPFVSGSKWIPPEFGSYDNLKT